MGPLLCDRGVDHLIMHEIPAPSKCESLFTSASQLWRGGGAARRRLGKRAAHRLVGGFRRGGLRRDDEASAEAALSALAERARREGDRLDRQGSAHSPCP